MEKSIKSRLYFISTRNEATGSCFSIRNLVHLLKKTRYSTQIITSHGNFFGDHKNLQQTNFNLLKIYSNLRQLYRLQILPNDTMIFNTILALPYYLFFYKTKNKLLYIHEQDLNPKFVYITINFIINFFDVKVICVNPSMLKRYKNAYLVPNYIDMKPKKISPNKIQNHILMISNCYLEKGVEDFIELANIHSNLQFVLLTNEGLMKDNCKEKLNNIPENLYIEFDQTQKEALLTTSQYLLSLSYANETFGLVLLEAVLSGTLPIAVENDGSRYCLNNNQDLVHQRALLYDNFSTILKKNNAKYGELLSQMQTYVSDKFSNESVINQLEEALK